MRDSRSGLGRRIRRELYRAPTGGLTRGELAILLIDVDDDEVSTGLEREIAAGEVVQGWAAGHVRYYLADAPAVAKELGLERPDNAATDV
jgi:hypothetical protein